MKRSVQIIAFLIAIAFSSYSCGGGYSSLLDEGNRLITDAHLLYVEYKICSKVETCSSEEVSFVKQNASGLEISFYRVESPELLSKLSFLCTSHFIKEMKSKSLLVQFHREHRRQQGGAGLYPTSDAMVTMKLEKNDADR